MDSPLKTVCEPVFADYDEFLCSERVRRQASAIISVNYMHTAAYRSHAELLQIFLVERRRAQRLHRVAHVAVHRRHGRVGRMAHSDDNGFVWAAA